MSSDKSSFSSYSQINAFLQIANFRFFAQRNPDTAHNIVQNNALQNRKLYRKILSLIQSKELAEISTVSSSSSFQFS